MESFGGFHADSPIEKKMLYFTGEKFEWHDARKINEWSTERGADRAARSQMLATEFAFCCEKLGIQNWLGLFCYAAAISKWFQDAPVDNVDQMKWAESFAVKFSEVKDLRLMPGVDEDKRIVMELIWHQATQVLTRYAELKGLKKETAKEIPAEKPVETKPAEKKPVEKKPVEKKPAETKTDQEPDQKKSKTKQVIGSIAVIVGAVADKLPVNAAIKSVIKAVSWAIGAIFR